MRSPVAAPHPGPLAPAPPGPPGMPDAPAGFGTQPGQMLAPPVSAPQVPQGQPWGAPAEGHGDEDYEQPEEGEAEEPAPRELPYLPGLDGLRGVALLAVLAFNGSVAVVKGGFLAISTALTLSGFLLASGMISEWAHNARLYLTDLWARRAARLLPAYYTVIALVVVLQLTLRVGSVPTFRTDVWAALGLATNVRLMYPPTAFTHNFAELSALRHLWPVAIVAQLTVLLPLAFSGIMAIASRRSRIAGGLFALAAAGSFALAWIMSGNPNARDVVTYGTHTRAGEVLVGVVLGYVVLTPNFRKIVSRPPVLKLIRIGSILAVAGLVALWMFTSPSSDFVFRGATLLNALLTCWVLLAVTMPSLANTTLSTWPLRKLGEISFAAYLLHWPLFLLLDEDRIGLEGIALFGVRVAVTLAAAIALSWTIEATFRWRLQLPRVQLIAGLGLVVAVLAVGVAVLPVNPPANISLTVNDGNGPGELDVVTPAGGAAGVADVLLIGDGAAASLVPGFTSWNEANPDSQVTLHTHITDDCPLGGPGPLRRFGEEVETELDCEAWRFRLPEMLEATDYDAIIMLMGSADLGERQVNREWVHLGDPAYDLWMADQLAGVASTLETADAPVVWLTEPHMRLVPEESDGDWAAFDDNDPERVNRLNALVADGLANRQDFQVLDLDAWLHSQTGGEFNPQTRSAEGLTELGAMAAVSWLTPEVLSAAGAAGPDEAGGSGEAGDEGGGGDATGGS